MQVTPLDKMGSNMVKVFGRLKKQLDHEPVLESEIGGYPSEAWVQWYMRQNGVPRPIAVDEGYKRADHAKQIRLYGSLLKFPENDQGLKVLGITRIQDYYAMGGKLVRSQMHR